MQNPFTLIFGKNPMLSVARPEQTNEIIEAFSEKTINQPLFMITGIRGSGKTVMMTEVARTFEEEKNWIIVELNPATDMLESLLSKLYSHKVCTNIIREAKIDLSFWSIGLELSGETKITDKETAIIKVLESIKKKGKRVLVLVDEAINNQYMQVFASSFQIFIRHDLPICLLMTGLFENIDDLQNEPNLTFLHRAPKITPKPLNRIAMSEKYMSVMENLSSKEALEMAALTKGYSFAFQVLGYLTWRNNKEYKGVLTDYRLYLQEYVYDKLWSEFSPRDKALAIAIAKSKGNSVKEIREAAGMSSNEFNPYRKRLLKKGIIKSDEWGTVEFTVPMFKEFILEEESIY